MTMGAWPAPRWIAPPYRNFWTRAQAGWPECRRRPEGLPRDADRVWPRTGRLRRGAGAAVGRLNATCSDGARRDRMANEIRNGGSKMRVVVRLLGHRDDGGAWEIHDFRERRGVGDVGYRSIQRVATAAGAMAIAFVHRYLEETA